MKTILLAISCFCIFFGRSPLKRYRIDGYAQGTTWQITYYATDSIVTKKQIDSILDKIDSSLSLYKPYSVINQFNASEEGIMVDDHFANVVNKALEVYQQTNGLFDITIYPLTAAWGFGPKKPDSLPDATKIRALLPCVNSGLIYWSGKKLMKKSPCVKLDANGIAQGYSADVLASFLEQHNIHDYLAEIGGEMRLKGSNQQGNNKMSIGIEAPYYEQQPEYAKIVFIKEGALTTSGNYRQFYESKGKRISHLLDPKTGYPSQNELISVTVYAKDAMTADAWDNALMAMGLKGALQATEANPHIAAYFIYQNKNGSVADTASKKFTSFFLP